MAREPDHRLDAMITAAVIDAYGEDEELAGFHACGARKVIAATQAA
ncbi:hypothetical protein ACH4VM_35785 [Streptomyces sp. NPDC020792]